ncbi:MAG TPA: long-chain fatty acid--CoA ligase [Gaiellaceae bacterium]|jgi:long-chain acyl-CoA synthetase|nr:long-chain fatty acid--CoA ligase [Gaiellaceae bacterium]
MAVGERSTVATRTIPALWRRATSAGRTEPAYLVQGESGWEAVSWEEAGRRADELAHGFLALGLRKGDAFAILGNTRLEWALVNFALAQIGVVVIPVYPTSSPADCAYVLGHSEALGIICEDDEMRDRIEGIRDQTQLERLLTFDDLDELAARGRDHAAANPGALGELSAGIAEDDVLTIVYTSGTTGPPKGCIMLHKNYAAVVDALSEIHINLAGDVVLLFLPLAHTYAQLVLYDAAGIGFTVAFCPDILRVAEALEEVHPSGMPSVPRVYEKVHAAVTAKLDEATGVQRRIADWALRVGYRASRVRQQGRALPPGLALQRRIADKLVYSKVKERLGGRLRAGVSGAAPISVEILEFFHAMDILILEGYGLTESSSGCSVNREDNFRFGTVGLPLPGIQVQIADDGEILVRGDNVFAGYYKDEEATRRAIDEDGWLHTGDVGTLDDDGFLRVTDRKKDIIVTAGGKNVAPQNLENDLKRVPGISQAVVVGDRRPYLVALITVEPGVADPEPLAQAAVDEVNRERTRYEQIKKFIVLERDFSPELGEVTPTMKLRRKAIVERFADDIDRLYAG